MKTKCSVHRRMKGDVYCARARSASYFFHVSKSSCTALVDAENLLSSRDDIQKNGKCLYGPTHLSSHAWKTMNSGMQFLRIHLTLQVAAVYSCSSEFTCPEDRKTGTMTFFVNVLCPENEATSSSVSEITCPEDEASSVSVSQLAYPQENGSAACMFSRRCALYVPQVAGAPECTSPRFIVHDIASTLDVVQGQRFHSKQCYPSTKIS